MELYKNLIDIIDSHRQGELEKLYAKEHSLHARIISDLLKQPGISSEQMLAKYEVSEGTFNKTLTYVKDILWDFNTQYIKTSYDDIFVLRQMLLNGKIKNALKFYNALKKNFETTQQWDKIDCLYTEGLRYAQITGDDAMAIKLSEERKKNSTRLHTYTLIYSDIIPEMIRLESYKLKKFDAAYAHYIDSLYKRAVDIDHHLLIHNALHIQYLFYSRYKNSPQEVFNIIQAVKNNAEKFKGVMADITYAIAINNYVNFLTIYRNFGSPEEYVRPLKKIIHYGGKIAIVNFYYSMLEYALFEKKTDELQEWLQVLEKTEDNSKFAQYKYIVIAIKAYIEKDLAIFIRNFHLFYQDPSHLNFPDLEITLRILEAMMYVEKKEGDLAVSRLQALRIFIGRSVDKDRYMYERKIVAVLHKINEGKKDLGTDMQWLRESPYRNIYFIVSMLEERLLPRR